MFRRLFRKSPIEESIYADMRKLLASTLDIDQVYPRLAEILNRILPYDQLVITDIDARRKVRISHFSGVEFEVDDYGSPIDLKGTLTDQVIQSRSPYLYQRKHPEQIAAEHPWLVPTADVGINSWLAVPLISQREVFGAIVVTSKVVDAFTQQAIDILVHVSAEIAPMFANSHLYMELVRRNAELEALQRDSRAMLDFYPDGILVEVDGKIAYCNPAIIDLSGYAEVEILDSSPTGFIAAEDRERAVAVVGKLLAGTPGDTREYRVSKKDGTIMPTEISSRLITYAGKPALLSVIRDITERKAAEDSLGLRTQELEALFNIANVLVQPGNFEEKATTVLEEMVLVAGADWVTFRQRAREGNGLQLVAVAGPASQESPPIPLLSANTNLAFDAIRQGEIVVVDDYAAQPNASANIVALGMHSMILMPVKVGGQILGMVNVVSRKASHFTPDLVKLLSAITDGLGVLLENSQLGRNLQANVEEMAAVDEIARIMTSTLDINQVYEQFASEVKKLVEFDRISIIVIDQTNGTYSVRYAAGLDVPNRNVGDVQPLKGTLPEHMTRTHQTVISPDLSEGTLYDGIGHRISEIPNRIAKAGQSIGEEIGLLSGIAVPMISAGQVVATLSVFSSQVGAYGPREQRIMERLASQISPAMKNAQLYERVVSELEQREQAEEALRESETRFRQIADNMREVVFLVDHREYNVMYMNQAFEEIWGLSPDSIYEKPLDLARCSAPG